jgi:transposase
MGQRLENIAKEHPDRRIEVWFEDEARFGQQGTLARVWTRRGTRPRAVKQTGYEWLYVLAAVCPSNGRTEGLLLPYIDARLISIFLQQFSKQLPDDTHAVLIWDQAGFHKSAEVVVPANITIIELPAYSPELNPVENLWQCLRSHYWANRSYENYDALREAACDSWQAACLDEKLIQNICRCSYIERKNLL